MKEARKQRAQKGPEDTLRPHRELHSTFCNNPHGKRISKRMNICTRITESLSLEVHIRLIAFSESWMSSATPTSSASKTGTKTSDAAMTPKLGRVLPGTGEQPSGIQAQNLRGQSSDQPACYPRP
ncbi:hypothetical protein FD754_005291 [Muntiacus muntjak]|uniref:Uncharacterized protein n=1 Tax=Muntiacus muntjak TaxID=9888 RepID=A0A5N3WK87_MUNMU|nr:hypothetical protein FD754_005291 [Muntiacus muntjak]